LGAFLGNVLSAVLDWIFRLGESGKYATHDIVLVLAGAVGMSAFAARQA
jgi:hypothetical protein